MNNANGRPRVGRIVRGASASVSGADAFNALNQVVTASIDYARYREEQKARREDIAAERDKELARIRASEQLIARYFEHVFSERSQQFADLFERLDSARIAGDTAAASQTLEAIVGIAQVSPLSGIGDLNVVRSALQDPDHTFEL